MARATCVERPIRGRAAAVTGGDRGKASAVVLDDVECILREEGPCPFMDGDDTLVWLMADDGHILLLMVQAMEDREYVR